MTQQLKRREMSDEEYHLACKFMFVWDDSGFAEREAARLSAQERCEVLGWGDDYFTFRKRKRTVR